MFTHRQKNKTVIDMYKENNQPFIETVITMRSPIERDSELYRQINGLVAHQPLVLKKINQKVNDDIGEAFEADVVSVVSRFNNNNEYLKKS